MKPLRMKFILLVISLSACDILVRKAAKETEAPARSLWNIENSLIDEITAIIQETKEKPNFCFNKVDKKEQFIFTEAKEGQNDYYIHVKCSLNDEKIDKAVNAEKYNCKIEFHKPSESSTLELVDVPILKKEGKNEIDPDFRIHKYVKNYCQSEILQISKEEIKKILKKLTEIDKHPSPLNKLKVDSVDETSIKVSFRGEEQTPINFTFSKGSTNSSDVLELTTPYSTNKVDFVLTDLPFVESEVKRVALETINQYEKMTRFISEEKESQNVGLVNEFNCEDLLKSAQTALTSITTEDSNGAIFKVEPVDGNNLTLKFSCKSSQSSDFSFVCSEFGSDVRRMLSIRYQGGYFEIPMQNFIKNSFYNVRAISDTFIEYYGNIISGICE
jgi:hypothetical protein